MGILETRGAAFIILAIDPAMITTPITLITLIRSILILILLYYCINDRVKRVTEQGVETVMITMGCACSTSWDTGGEKCR